MKKTALGFCLGLFIALVLTAFAGESPWDVLLILLKSAFGTRYDFGLTLFYTTPLIFCGLSVAWAFRVGLFNIGAEGQLTVACIALIGVGVVAPDLGSAPALFLALIVPLLAGALWGYIAGWLKARRQAHEVIVTMMMNFVAMAMASYSILNLFPNPNSQNPESILLPSQYLFKSMDPLAILFPESGVSLALPLAIMLALISWFLFNHSQFGYRMKMVGLNPLAAQRAGIPIGKIQIIALSVAGALAGGVAWAEILGSSGQFKLGFSPDYGFLGIAVALMAQNHPLGILLSAFLIGALHKGAADLDMETVQITRDFSKVIQALIVLFVASPGLWTLLQRLRPHHFVPQLLGKTRRSVGKGDSL